MPVYLEIAEFIILLYFTNKKFIILHTQFYNFMFVFQGEYKIENATLDSNILMNIPGIPGHYWTLRLQLLTENKVVSCTDMEGELHHNPPQSMRLG